MKVNQPEKWEKLAQMNKERGAKSYAKNKDRRAELNLKQYGLSQKEWDEMFHAQNQCCAICGKHQSNFKYRLAVDHCHSTGKIRALLCPKCNNAVAAFENYAELVQNYLERFK